MEKNVGKKGTLIKILVIALKKPNVCLPKEKEDQNHSFFKKMIKMDLPFFISCCVIWYLYSYKK